MYKYIFIYIYIYTRGLRISVARPQPQLGFLPADLKERQVETQKMIQCRLRHTRIFTSDARAFA